MKHPQILALLLFFAGLLACQLSVGIAPTPTHGPTPAISATTQPSTLPAQTQTFTPPATATLTSVYPSPIPSETPTTEPAAPRTQYTLSVSFDVAVHRALISQTIRYTNLTGERLDELLLIVEAARSKDVFTLKNITWPGGIQAGKFRIEGGFLYLPFAEALAPGQEIVIALDYELQLALGGGALGYTARQVNFGDWYPYIPPYRAGTGWLAYQPTHIGEHLNYELADFNVSIESVNAPAGWEIIAPGEVGRDGASYRFLWSPARSFAWTGSEQYVSIEGIFAGVRVRQVTFPRHENKAAYALQVIGQALILYSELFGPYPHDELLAVEGDFFDGMEYDGLFFLGEEYFLQHDGTPAGYLTALSAHETAHQWWYGLVGNDQAWQPWLDEALCTYSEYLYYERYAPNLLPWWWEYRADRFQPRGWVNSTIYDHASFRSYVDAVYLRGAHFLHEMRLCMGDEAFFRALKIYAAQWGGKLATSSDFLAVLNDHTSTSCQDVILRYFRSEP